MCLLWNNALICLIYVSSHCLFCLLLQCKLAVYTIVPLVLLLLAEIEGIIMPFMLSFTICMNWYNLLLCYVWQCWVYGYILELSRGTVSCI